MEFAEIKETPVLVALVHARFSQYGQHVHWKLDRRLLAIEGFTFLEVAPLYMIWNRVFPLSRTMKLLQFEQASLHHMSISVESLQVGVDLGVLQRLGLNLTTRGLSFYFLAVP